MALTNAAKEAAALAISALGDRISLHTNDPGTTGANEATGGSPAYARKTTTWSAGASDGVVAGSEVAIDAPAGTYTHMGVWTSGGVFVAGSALSSSTGSLPGQTVVRLTPTITVP